MKWYELVDPKQGYNNAKFEKPCFNRVYEKANNKGCCFFSNQDKGQLFPLNMCKSQKQWYIHDLLHVLQNPANFQNNQART